MAALEERVALVEFVLRLGVRFATWRCPVCGTWALADEDRPPAEPHLVGVTTGGRWLGRHERCPGRREVVALSVKTRAEMIRSGGYAA